MKETISMVLKKEKLQNITKRQYSVRRNYQNGIKNELGKMVNK